MLLWLLVLVLLLRGLAGVVVPREAAPTAPVVKASSPVWPDDAARAFAADFARAYLGFSGDPEASARAVQAFVSPELASSVAPQFADHARRQAVGSATVARIVRLDGSRALVTVAVAVDGASSRYVTVPVARDAHGGLVVSDLPSFAAAPARATVSPPATEAVPAAERAAIEDVSTRYLRAYLGGDAGALRYLAPPGTPVIALAEKLQLVDVESLGLAAAPRGGERRVLASARVGDPAGGATFEQLFRLELVHGGQWLVASINDAMTRKEG